MPSPPVARSPHRAARVALLAGVLGLCPLKAEAVEVLQLRLPLLGDSLSARVSELRSPAALWNGNSDLAELNRATNGVLADDIEVFVNHPLPPGDFRGSPMVQQIHVMLEQLVEVDDGKTKVDDLEPVVTALKRLKDSGRPTTLLNLLEELPGQKVVIRLDKAVPFLRRAQRHSRDVEQLLANYPSLPAASAQTLARGRFPTRTDSFTLPAADGQEALDGVLVLPVGAPSLPPVVISHGLWDAPASFLGWAQYLASHGFPVILPRHPGSDLSQQAAMLAGKSAPPSPREFLRRPNDVRRVLDALDSGTIPAAAGIRAREVTFIGHSWGGTTALQLAGARSLPTPLWKDCSRADNPQRNLSWVLQCSFLPAASPASQADLRIVRVMAVSPPQALVFAAGLMDLRVPVLLVSGSQDFVVPSKPEAVLPYRLNPRQGNYLVMAEGGTHFNLPADASTNGGPLRALMLSWVNGKPLNSGSRVADPQALPLHLITLSSSGPVAQRQSTPSAPASGRP